MFCRPVSLHQYSMLFVFAVPVTAGSVSALLCSPLSVAQNDCR